MEDMANMANMANIEHIKNISELTLSKIAGLSYKSENDFKREIDTYVENNALDKPINITFFNAYETNLIDSQIYALEYSNKIIFSIKGSPIKRGILTDLYVCKKTFNDSHTSHYIDKKYKGRMKVHRDFLEQYNSLKFFTISNVFKLFWNFNQQNDIEKIPIKIIFTSHDSGAAISVLLSTLLKSHFGCELYISNYLFGCPKIGNRTFVDFYNNIIDETYCYINQNDIIPRIPKLNYKNTKNIIILGNPKDSYISNRLFGNINDHDIKQYINRLSILEDLEKFMKGEKIETEINTNAPDILMKV